MNGEIDIVEGVNYQSVAKTALHSTQICKMDDVPLGTKTGGWDTAVGSELSFVNYSVLHNSVAHSNHLTH